MNFMNSSRSSAMSRSSVPQTSRPIRKTRHVGKDIKDVCIDTTNHRLHYVRRQRLLEYYDSRAAVSAAKATHGKEYKTGVWDVNFFWDQGLK